jgi:recombination DNA repair RAD52 pathway protein
LKTMAFSEQQLRRLVRALPQQVVKTRSMDGFEMRYIEGWYAIQEANRIFGFDGWSRETLSLVCIHAKPSGNLFTVSYSCRVRIQICTAERGLYRDGTGFGQAQAATLGLAHEQAAKSAEPSAPS